jgi:hypothetical protein
MARPHTGPLDFSELAHGLVQRMTGEDDADEAAEESPQAAAGRKGGKARAAALSADERAAIAAKGGEARWAASAD